LGNSNLSLIQILRSLTFNPKKFHSNSQKFDQTKKILKPYFTYDLVRGDSTSRSILIIFLPVRAKLPIVTHTTTTTVVEIIATGTATFLLVAILLAINRNNGLVKQPHKSPHNEIFNCLSLFCLGGSLNVGSGDGGDDGGGGGGFCSFLWIEA
jgi:hypothetical protein